MTPQIGDALLIHHISPDLEDKVISRITSSPWQHVACVAKNEIVEALPSGVISSPLDKYDNPSRYSKLVITTLKPIPKIESYLGFLKANMGDSYGFLDLFQIGVFTLLANIGIKKFLDSKNSVITKNTTPICSQLYIEAIRAGGLNVFDNINAGLISPAKIADDAMSSSPLFFKLRI